MPGANTPLTVANETFICGIDIPTLFQGDSQAERISREVFDDDFVSCIDKTVKELDNCWKLYSTLTSANGQIHLNLRQKNNFKSFIQWTREQYRLGLDTVLTLFPVANVATYINRYKHYEAYINKASTLSDTDKPEQFTDKIKWIVWYPTLINFFREIPGSNGVPLSYLFRPTNMKAKTVYDNFIE